MAMDTYGRCGYIIHIGDATGRNFAVRVDAEPGLIGHMYTFSPFKAVLVEDGYDEADFHYFRKAKEPIPAGTEVTLGTWWRNFYGSYYRIAYGGHAYDVNTRCVKIDIDSFLGKEGGE